VTVQGWVVRVFRQGSVGSFPPLAEVWITSAVGDPFCLVFPQARLIVDNGPEQDAHANEGSVPEPGRLVHFTGTFLKFVRYAASDGARLTPLIVGDLSPVTVTMDAQHQAGRSRSNSPGGTGRRDLGGGLTFDAASGQGIWSPVSWALGSALAVLAIGILAWQHLRGVSHRLSSTARSPRTPVSTSDPPLHFLDSSDGLSV
jgi:hypothetical protein